MVGDPALPRTSVSWQQATRLIRDVYPPIQLFEDIADPADWELIAQGEARTNPRVRDELGSIHLVPPTRRVSGPGASRVMAPFVHVSPERPTRFSSGEYGAYYCGDRFEVALAETIHHFERAMAATEEAPLIADYRELVGTVALEAHDLRLMPTSAYLNPDDWSESQLLGQRLRAAGSEGIVYPSVRYPRGEALAVFWPNRVGIPKPLRHLAYRWNGRRCDAYLVYGHERWVLLEEQPHS